MVHIGVLLPGYLCRKEIGEHLFCPHVIEPAHGHHVAKPHVCRFVGYQLQTCLLLLWCGVFAEEYLVVGELYRSGMFHSAELESGEHHHIILAEREGYAGISFKPPYGVVGNVEHLVELRHLVGVGLPVECLDGTAAAFCLLDAELSCHEGEEICRDKLVGDR